MSKNKVIVLSDGLKELMKSQEMQDELEKQAQKVVGRCNGSYDTDVYVGKTRANASIVTHDSETFYRNLKNNELLKALGI